MEALWSVVAAAGGTLAFTFIVLLALGLLSLTLFYLASAVVVLERFARVARRPLPLLLCAGLLSLGVAALGVPLVAEEAPVLPWGEWLTLLLRLWAWTGGMCVVATGLLVLAFHRLSPERLGAASALWLGLAASAWLGSAGNPVLAAAPVAVLGGLYALLRAFRARRPGAEGKGGPVQRLLAALALALAPAPLVALAAGEPQVEWRLVGTGLAQLYGVGIVLGLLPLALAGLLRLRHSVEWFIAVRYLVAKRRQVFISAITGICVAGIAAGVWLIIVVLSVMNGFERTWREEIVGNRAHFTVHHHLGAFDDYPEILARVRASEGVVGASPYLDAEGMVRSREGSITAVRLRGIDPESVGDVTDLPDDLISGSIDDLLWSPHEGNGSAARDPGILVGHHLALSLGLTEGDRVLLISPYGGPPTPLGPAPRLKPFRVVGVFESSFFQYDEVFTYTSLGAAQDFRRAGDVVDGIEARTTDYYRSRRVADQVRNDLDYPFYTRDWKEFFPAFFQALKTERVMMFILLTMIMVVAAFVIVATLVMMIMEKSSDIAILKTMGAEDGLIERIFALEGTLIGVVGTLLGVVAGVAVTDQLTWIQRQVEWITGIDTLPASIYQFSTLPTQVDGLQIAGVAVVAMVLSLGATLLPSRQGARLDPAESLRYE